MKEKCCVITGANAGLGYETALALSKKRAEVIMICRSKERGEKAKREIIKQTGNGQVHLVIAELSSQANIRNAAKDILKDRKKIDVLVNNAGIVLSKQSFTDGGIDMLFAINHLAYFLLSHLLLPALANSEDGRIINVSSSNHKRAKIYFEDLNLTNNYHVLRAYGQSKLANILFTYELDRKLRAAGISQLSTNCLHPGLNNTDIGIKHASWLHRLVWRYRKRKGMEAAEGAQCQIYLASAEEVRNISGKYWYLSEQVPSSKRSYNVEDAASLWAISKQLCQIEKYIV